MELTNEFKVGLPVEDAWVVLTDVERIAPCMPGAELQEVEGDEYRGIVKVKVGPITAQYKGAARFVEKDDGAHRAVLRAEGRDTRGQGNASATITARLTADGGGTHVRVETDLTVTGKVAQFGRGVLVDVSGRLLDQFVACLESDVLSGTPTGDGPPAAMPAPPASQAPAAVAPPPPAPAAAESPQTTSSSTAQTTVTETDATTRSTNGSSSDGIRKITSSAAEPVDLLGAAGAPVAKRALPVIGAVVLLVLLFRRRRRRR